MHYYVVLKFFWEQEFDDKCQFSEWHGGLGDTAASQRLCGRFEGRALRGGVEEEFR